MTAVAVTTTSADDAPSATPATSSSANGGAPTTTTAAAATATTVTKMTVLGKTTSTTSKRTSSRLKNVEKKDYNVFNTFKMMEMKNKKKITTKTTSPPPPPPPPAMTTLTSTIITTTTSSLLNVDGVTPLPRATVETIINADTISDININKQMPTTKETTNKQTSIVRRSNRTRRCTTTTIAADDATATATTKATRSTPKYDSTCNNSWNTIVSKGKLPPPPTTNNIVFTPYTVVCGRGSTAYAKYNPGNLYFRQLIEDTFEEYEKAPSKCGSGSSAKKKKNKSTKVIRTGKSNIGYQILQKITKEKKGNFIIYDHDLQQWVQLEDENK